MEEKSLFDFNFERKVIKDPPPEVIDEPLQNNPNKENLRIKTEEWIQKHPNVYDLYKKYSMQLLDSGRPFSISLITERIRWECYFEYKEDFKISNDYRAYIARKLAEDIPQLKTVLKFKRTQW